MCLYELRPAKPLKLFFCVKLREILLACPPACPYYIAHPARGLEEFLYEMRCINLDFITVKDDPIPVCLVIPGHTPDCSDCPSKKDTSKLLLSSFEHHEKMNNSHEKPNEWE
ncbi:MAG: hypothetical protein ACXADY_02975 [Candidatus Hodarchaeales archaeon]